MFAAVCRELEELGVSLSSDVGALLAMKAARRFDAGPTPSIPGWLSLGRELDRVMASLRLKAHRRDGSVRVIQFGAKRTTAYPFQTTGSTP